MIDEQHKRNHDVKNLLHRLSLMADLLINQDFKHFSKEEIMKDAQEDLEKLKTLFNTYQ